MIRSMSSHDIEAVALVHEAAFRRQKLSHEWIACNFRAFPRMLLFVAAAGDGTVAGYIHWTQKSGFRPSAVLELEQIAVHPKMQGRGIGGKLILESLPLVQKELTRSDSVIKHIMVTTRADNDAQKLYEKTLGVEIEASIRDLYSADEVIMVRRNFKMES